MFFKKKSEMSPIIYDQILNDVKLWCINELASASPEQQANFKNNALLNFAAFDLHKLMLQEGFNHMLELLSGSGTDQTVMIRLKNLVEDLYIKYGDSVIDELRERVYSTLTNLYGISFNLDEKLDVNNTLWLQPFVRRWYTELKLQK